MKAVRLAAVALALGAVAIAVFAWPAGAAGPDESRGLTVSGTGTVSAVPDIVEWSFGVQTDAATAREALRKNAGAIDAVIRALKSSGIAAEDLRTEQVSVFPRTGNDGTQVVGYTATNSVHAVVRDIAKAGAIVDAAADAGANQIYGPSLTVSKTDDLYGQALEQAYDQALTKGKRLAAKAGVALGRPLSIVEGGGGTPIPVAEAAKGGAADTPIQPGTTQIQATVTITFAIS